MEEYQPGDLVWFDPGLGYLLPGEVTEFSKPAQVVIVRSALNGKVQDFTLTNLESVRKRQDLGENGYPDMIDISDLNEASLLWNLKIRYDKGMIYTYTGSILVSVNPYKMSDMYGLDAVKRYEGQILGTLPPHLFAIGSAAYSKMSKDNENQVVVISGESGAGKTENTKLIMQYLAAVNKSHSNLVTEQILEASPLLEAFGNAKTIKNDNSSRFGKHLEIYFNDGVITGARTTEYLLEKSRIVTQAPEERNYHVFYEMLAGLSDTEKEKYGLQSAQNYFYMNQGGAFEIPGKNDGDDFRSLLSAMQVLGLTSEEQDVIFRILSSVLHLGNVYFHRKPLKHGQEGVEIGTDAEIRWASHLLQLSVEGITRALTTRTTEARNEKMLTPLNIDQALDARDAIAKALYSCLFSWLVQRINNIVCKGTKKTSLAILDIFGFEDFKENSFEQLCINYANETLQAYFTRHVFRLEQQEYAREKIEWQPITFQDNTPVLHLIAKKPVGLLPLLDDESNFPKATDLSFLEKCHYNHALNELYSRPRMSSMEFGIRHYAGQVWYSVDGFLDKNRDTLRSNVLHLLISSRLPMISKMFQELRQFSEASKTMSRSNGRFVTMKPRTPTVAARFNDSLQALVEIMSKCTPWFIRCIKPNNEKAAMKFDIPIVLEQLRYSGMLETIRIRKLGYPVRHKFSHFADRYRCLVPGRIPRGAPHREMCKVILDKVSTCRDHYQLGSSKVFLREALEQRLEKERVEILGKAAIIIQRFVRGFLAQRRYRLRKGAAIRIQTAFRAWRERKKYTILKKGVIRAQATFRMMKQKREYDEIKSILARRAEAEKVAKARAKERQAREEQDRATWAVAGVSHLEVPSDLATVFSRLEEWQCIHEEGNIIKHVGPLYPPAAYPDLRLPLDIDQFGFSKFTNIYFKAHVWGMKREPIKTPFLAKASEADQQESLAIFKLILRFMNETNLTPNKERALADYIVQKGLSNPALRDEILCQLCNQTWRNENPSNRDRGWLLLDLCLSTFGPSSSLYKYLLKYVSDNTHDKGRAQHKLLTGRYKAPAQPRTYPPCSLEWKANQRKANMALHARFPDTFRASAPVDSWTTGEEFAASLIQSRGVEELEGWTVDLVESGNVYGLNGDDYVLDLISEMELPPAFPACKSYFLVSPGKPDGMSPWISSPHNPDKYNVYEVDGAESPPAPIRRKAIPLHPILPPQVPVKESELKEKVRARNEKIMASRTHTIPEDKIRSNTPPECESPHISKTSALNERYFDKKVKGNPEGLQKSDSSKAIASKGGKEKRHSSTFTRSKSPEDLFNKAGLSETSKLNKRYIKSKSEQIGSVPKEMDPKTASSSDLRSCQSATTAEQSGQQWQSDIPLASSSALNDRYFAQRSSKMSTRTDCSDIGSSRADLSLPGTSSQDRLDQVNGVTASNGPPQADSRSSISSSPMSSNSSVPGEFQDLSRINDLDDEEATKMSRTSEQTRYVKYSARSNTGQYSRSTRAHIDKSRDSDYARSSAMSDTSETTSIASRFLHVHVPDAQQGSDIDDYLDELFNPMLDAEMSESRSQATSIRGEIENGEEFSDLMDAEKLSQCLKGGGETETHGHPVLPGMGLISPPMVSIPGAGANGDGGGLPMINMAGMTVPMVDSSQIIQQQYVQQQMLQIQQRAFLASAFQQNLQIQQQLMHQNQALQQLLQTGNNPATTPNSAPQSFLGQSPMLEGFPGGPVFPGLMTPNTSFSVAAPLLQTFPSMENFAAASTPNRPLQRPTFSPPPPPPGGPCTRRSPDTPKDVFVGVLNELKIRAGGDEKGQRLMRPSSIPPPPPPPPPPPSPPPLSPDSQEKYQKVYGRAKTVRIGKWRWPPPREEGGDNSFIEFKMKKGSQENEPSSEDINTSQSSSQEECFPHTNGESPEEDVVKSFQIGDCRPPVGSIGKLKISSEMKAKLEQLTIDHSVRSTNNHSRKNMFQIAEGAPTKPHAAPIRKLDESRKAALERQLNNGSIREDNHDAPPALKHPPPPKHTPQDIRHIEDIQRKEFVVENLVRSQVEKMERASREIRVFREELGHPLGGVHRVSPGQTNEEALRAAWYYKNAGPMIKAGLLPAPSSVGAGSSSYYAPCTPVIPRSRDMPPRRISDKIEFVEISDFLRPVEEAPVPETADLQTLKTLNTKLQPPCSGPHLTYTRVTWELHVRKEVFMPGEKLSNALAIHLVFCQIVNDVYSASCLRLHRKEKQRIKQLIENQGVTIENLQSHNHKLSMKKGLIEQAKECPSYFSRFFPVSGGKNLPNVQMLGVSHTGVRLITRERDSVSGDFLRVLDTLSFEDISEVTLPKPNTLQVLLRNGGWMTLYSPKAVSIRNLVERFCIEMSQASTEYVQAIADYITRESSLLCFRKGDKIRLVKSANLQLDKGWLYGVLETGETGIFPCEYVAPIAAFTDPLPIKNGDSSPENAGRYSAQESHTWFEDMPEDPGSDDVMPITDGQYSLLQFALYNFRDCPDKYEMLKNQEESKRGGPIKLIESLKFSRKNKKDKSSDWTWKELVDLVKFTKSPLQSALLRMDDPELDSLAQELFINIMVYMGDYPAPHNKADVEAVYNILVCVHRNPGLRDELYCQIMKQTTNNKSSKPDSCIRGWRLFSMITAYFQSSEGLKPYLFKYLETAAYDTRRAYHGTARVCLHNLRKTYKYGGRKNVPGIEEVAAISAGRNHKRQMFRIPGGSERVVNTKSTTVVQDIIEEMCSALNVRRQQEMDEFSLYCVVDGDPYSLPLGREEYILDVTTELHKEGAPFYLIFCRSVWVSPVRLDNALSVEVAFNQVAPDYLEGLLLEWPVPSNSPLVLAMARGAALLQRASGAVQSPLKEEIRYLIPKPAVIQRDISSSRWQDMVSQSWEDMAAITPTEAKAQFLEILQKFPFFGSCFFLVKVVDSSKHLIERLLVLNKEGIHFVDVDTHKLDWSCPFKEVVSTRKVRAENCVLFLDLKCGDLMNYHITRIQTDQAHEVSRLIKQYMQIEQHRRTLQ